MMEKHPVRMMFEQLNRLLQAKGSQGDPLMHRLEKGLGNEESVRQVLRATMPARYGIAKGKLVNPHGVLSRHLDVIIYDALNCPVLFADEHRNQILPIEGAYAAIEVKSTLTSTTLADAFSNLASVEHLHERVDCSTNDFVNHRPPYLMVFAYSDARTLQAIKSQYIRLSREHAVTASAYSYSEKSPGHADHTGEHHLVCEVAILGKGGIYHMLDGSVKVGEWDDHSLGMFVSTMIVEFAEIELPRAQLLEYYNWLLVEQWLGKRR